ncbi:hypothetical protein [Luteococcus peritonei]|uniref:Uncharacterized protein n=1 Tax=Luteococcus peritonei TaxID=88874 RepID=A0ABW4RTR3_9ACTN
MTAGRRAQLLLAAVLLTGPVVGVDALAAPAPTPGGGTIPSSPAAAPGTGDTPRPAGAGASTSAPERPSPGPVATPDPRDPQDLPRWLVAALGALGFIGLLVGFGCASELLRDHDEHYDRFIG